MRRAWLFVAPAIACTVVDSLDGYKGPPIEGAAGAATDAGSDVDGSFVCVGQKLCDGKCVAIDDPTWGCSPTGCGPACSLSHAVPTCAQSKCAVASCKDGFGDCDGDPSNGCERLLGTMDDCSQCGESCSVTNGTAECQPDGCKITACTEPFSDCDGLASTGCETDLTTTGACGQCGRKCAAGFTCIKPPSGPYDCFCPNDATCGFNGGCGFGVCVCNGTACPIGHPCAPDGNCG